MRRTHSLNSLEEIAGKPKRILNIKEVRKSMLSAKRASKYNCLDKEPDDTSDENKETTMSKLRDSLCKLREHLDSLQKKKGLPYESDSEKDTSFKSNNNLHPTSITNMGSVYNSDQDGYQVYNDKRADDEDNNNDCDDASNTGVDDDTGGDTSLNESDAASDQRGTNDSAYASDRMSHSSKYRQEQRRNSYTSSDNSNGSPETVSVPSITKAHSLMELTGADGQYRPSRVKSASYAHSKTRVRRRAGDLIYENNHFHQEYPSPQTWSRRKECEAQRNARTAEVIRRTQSLQIRNLADHETDRPNSAENSSGSRPVSASSSRGKVRRALPKVPGTADDIEDRKKRMSMEALDKIKRNSIIYNSNVTDNISPASVTPPQAFKSTAQNNNKETIALHAQHLEHHDLPMYQQSQIDNYKDQYRLPPSNVYSYEAGAHDEQHHIFKPRVLSKQQSTSQEALQRIINDLKDAATTKSFEGHSRRNSQSSEGSVGRECDYTDPPPMEDQPQQYDFAQLAQWGVIQPSQEELLTYGTPYHQKSGGDNSESELKITHPSLHRIMKSCDLIHVTLQLSEKQANSQQYGLDVFESTFSDIDSEDHERRPIFRSPSGRRPVIGRKKGAFMPVTPVKSRRDGPILSLIAIDEIKENSLAQKNGEMQEGDYIIEVNGIYMGDAKLDNVKFEIQRSSDCLHLVLARYKTVKTKYDKGEAKLSDMSEKEVEKLKLKYAAMKQDSEKNMDQIAELKLEIKEKDAIMTKLHNTVGVTDDKLKSLEINLRKKDEAIAEWKYEANHRNIELARFKYESKQKDDRIVQLRRLLIQQTEVMQLQHGSSVNGDVSDLDDYEEHVSAV